MEGIVYLVYLIFGLIKWVFKSAYWFISQLHEDNLSKVTILVVLIPTILCAAVGVVNEVNLRQESFVVALVTILFGSLGLLIGIGIVYAVYSVRNG